MSYARRFPSFADAGRHRGWDLFRGWQQVSMALEQTYLLERLVDDLRLLTLAETRQLPFEIRPVDLHQLAQQLLKCFRLKRRRKIFHLHLKKEWELPR